MPNLVLFTRAEMVQFCCGFNQSVTKMASRTFDGNLHWYKDAIIYELHIKAFADSNQDGIGDFKGLISKLGYLQELGVTAIWLLPFYPSPLKDDGYDIADYYSINPSYGQLEDFKLLLSEAHNRGLKVITELVLNHTSDKHPWFQRARKSPKDSSWRNYYVWSDDPSRYSDVRVIFQDFESSNWTWDAEAEQFYWHRFFSHQPDLNYDSPDVQQEVFKILDFWCEMGVDGFRLDAVPYLFERENTNGENLPETHAFLKKLRKHIDDHYPGTMLLAEANMWPEDSASYFGDGDECQMNYHFPLMPRMYMALQMEDRYPILDILDQTPPIPDNCQWAIFLRNHDELTLEMVTDEERDYMYRVYVKDPKARINLGIRHRLAPLMSNNRKKIELLNYLLFSLPGTPVLYYGDEIGMGDNYYLGDRDGVRTPMQWNDGRNAGFSEANPHRLYLPVIQDLDYNYTAVNVEVQNRNPSSLLWWMKRMIAKRKQYKALAHGDIKFIGCDNSRVFAFTRSFQEETILVIVNLSRYAQPAHLILQDFSGQTPVEVFSRNKFPGIKKDQPYFLSLSSYDCQWFSLEKQTSLIETDKKLHEITLMAWDKTLNRSTRYQLEAIVIPDYLNSVRWFGGKGRAIESVKIIHEAVIQLTDYPVMMLILEVNYREGLSELYQLPVGIVLGTQAEELREKYPQSILCKITFNHENGFIYDAVFGTAFQEIILDNMMGSERTGTLYFSGNNFLKQYKDVSSELKPHIFSTEQSNTSVAYGQRFFFKLFRKLDYIVNADVEISRFLTEETGFTNMPAFAGFIEWNDSNRSLVLGVMQEMVDNSSDGWSYVLSKLDEMNETMLANPDIVRLSEELLKDKEVTLPSLQEFFEGTLTEHIRLLAVRTAELHKALASHHDIPAFAPEPYTLHYQRSLFSGFKTLVRNTFSNERRSLENLPENVRREAVKILEMQNEILDVFKNIYRKKIDVVKIRVHGDYHLGQVLFTGKDFIITDFEGEPARSYSERRLKRSPLRDVAGMIRSFHYAAYASLFLDNQIRKEDYSKLMPIVEAWYQHVSKVFLDTYQKAVEGTSFFPEKREDAAILITTFLLEKAIYELNYELNNRPDWVIIPLNGIKSIIEERRTSVDSSEVISVH